MFPKEEVIYFNMTFEEASNLLCQLEHQIPRIK